MVLRDLWVEDRDFKSFYEGIFASLHDTFKISMPTKEEKKELLAVLWQLVAVDKRIDPYEENLYFKIAGLIHIERTSANQIKQENL